MGERIKGTAYGDTLVLATAVYVVVARGDTENRALFLAEGVHERRGYGVKIATEGSFVVVEAVRTQVNGGESERVHPEMDKDARCVTVCISYRLCQDL